MSDTSPILNTAHSVAAALAARRAPPDETPEAPEAGAPEEEIEASEGDAPEPEEDDDLPPASGDEEEDGEPEETPVSAAPPSWPKARLDEWNELTPEAQEIVLARESEIQSAISEKGREAAEASKAANRLKTEYADRISKLDALLPKLAERAKSQWEAIDWKQLAKDEPDTYVQLKAEYEADKEALATATRERQQAVAEQRAEYQREQHKRLIDHNPQYAGEAGAKLLASEAQEVIAFARTLDGVTDEVLNDVGADIYQVLRDAMLYRKANKAPARPQKKPAQRTARPTARKGNEDIAKKTRSEAIMKVKEAKGRNAETAAVAALLAARRKG